MTGEFQLLEASDEITKKGTDELRVPASQMAKVERASNFVSLLKIPHKHVAQITIDICEEIQGLCMKPDPNKLGALGYRIGIVLDVCREDILDYYILGTLKEILNE